MNDGVVCWNCPLDDWNCEPPMDWNGEFEGWKAEAFVCWYGEFDIPPCAYGEFDAPPPGLIAAPNALTLGPDDPPVPVPPKGDPVFC